MKCKHERAYYFHENTPAYCPDCGEYLETLSMKCNSDKVLSAVAEKLIERGILK